MKKLFTVLLVLLAATCGMLGFAACDQKEPEPAETHVHEWGEWVSDGAGHHTRTCTLDETHVDTQNCSESFTDVVTSPTCEEGGYTTHTCSVCSYTCKDSETPKLDHDWRYTFDEETHTHSAVCHNDPTHTLKAEPCDLTNGLETKPTCTTDGYTTYICKTCLGTFTTYNEKTQHQTGHSYPETWQEMEGGKHYHICENPDCGAREEADCSFTKEVKTEPTCEAQGFTTKFCAGCGASKVDENSYVGPLDHDFETAEYHSDNKGNHYRQCTRDGCMEVEEEECSDFLVTTQEATCNDPGTETKVCKQCKYTVVSETESAKGHDYKDYQHQVIDGKHMHTATCSRPDCDEVDTAACVLSPEGKSKPATCTREGAEITVCPVCRHEETTPIPALEHDYGSWQPLTGDLTKHYRECIRNCGEDGARQEGTCEMVEGTSIPNSCTGAGSTAAKRCADCGRTENGEVIPANGHTWRNPQNEGWTPTANGKHYRECTKCNVREESTCSYETVETPAGCETDGQRTKTCSTCKDVKTEVIPRFGHTLENYTFQSVQDETTQGLEKHFHTGVCKTCQQTVREACRLQPSTTTPATCEADGTTTYTCLFCDHVHTYVTSEKTGHIYSNRYTFNAETHEHTNTCQNCGQTVTKTCTPDPDKVTTKSRTCIMGGYTQQTCSECGNTWKTDITESYNGHDWVVSEQSYNKQYNQHTVKCSRPGCLAMRLESCTYQDETVQPTCEADGYTRRYCTQCKGEQSKTVVHANGHVYKYDYTGNETDKHTHHITCENCNLSIDGDCELEPLTSVATCTKAGENDLICSVCSHILEREYSEALGHIYTYSPLYNNYHVRTCSRCNLRETVKCNLQRTIQQGNCVTPTLQIDTCTDCQQKTTVEKINPAGHQWGKWEVQDGDVHVRRCENCSAEETQNGHVFTTSNFCDCGEDGLTYTLVGTYYVAKGNSKLANTEMIVIPSAHGGYPVEEIAEFSFQACAKLNKLVISTSVKRIGKWAAYGRSTLKTVVIGNMNGDGTIDSGTPLLETIGEYAFSSCRNLTEFVLPQSLKTIGGHAFENCEKFDNFKIPEPLGGAEPVEIGSAAFTGTKLVNDAEKSMEGDGLYLGKHLYIVKNEHKGAFTIAPGTVSVAVDAFKDCAELTSVTIPASVKLFGKDAFEGCTGLESATFEGTVHQWFEIVFENDLASPLHYANVFSIQGAEGNIDFIPETVTSIPTGTFRNTAIQSITIPSSVKSIGAYAFYGCTQLSSITIEGELTYIGENAFAGTAYYKDKSKWNDQGLLYIGKNLIKANSGKNVEPAVAADIPADIAAPTLEEMTRIPAGVQITKGTVTIEKDTTTISPRAFENCTELNEVVIGENVMFIGKFAFSGCSGLTKATLEGKTSFLAWTLAPGTGEQFLGRSISPTDNTEQSKSDLAGYLKWGYLGEWTRYATA